MTIIIKMLIAVAAADIVINNSFIIGTTYILLFLSWSPKSYHILDPMIKEPMGRGNVDTRVLEMRRCVIQEGT